MDPHRQTRDDWENVALVECDQRESEISEEEQWKIGIPENWKFWLENP